MDLTVAIPQFLDHRRAKGLVLDSIKLYKRQLDDWHTWREQRGKPTAFEAITLDEFDRYFTYLANEHIPHGTNSRRPPARKPGLAPGTIASIRRTLRAFWTFARARGWISAEQAAFFGRDGVPAPRVQRVPRPVYTDNQLGAMLAACGEGEDETSARDRAVIALLWESGGRITELLGLNDANLDMRKRRAQVLGKGGVWRFVRWGPVTQVELVRYLQRRRGRTGGPVFRSTGPRAGTATRFTTDNARARFRRNMEEAGIEPAEGSPFHAFRRGWIQRGLKKLSLAHVSQLAGHADVRTTMLYALQNDDDLDAIYHTGYN